MNPRWNISEIKFLNDNYTQMSISEIAQVLNKTEKAVRRKAEKVSLKTGRKHEWLKAELQTLQENLDRPLKEVFELLGHKAKGSIIKKYYELKKARGKAEQQQVFF